MKIFTLSKTRLVSATGVSLQLIRVWKPESSVLGLLLGQGAEWKIQAESQHKEWENMIQK